MRRASMIEGFWLPRAVRHSLIAGRQCWEEACFARGRECDIQQSEETAEGVTARWPRFGRAEWTKLLEDLKDARERAPRGPAFWERLQAAMAAVSRNVADPGSPAHRVIETIPAYTGYSEAMVGSVMAAQEIWDLRQMAFALTAIPTRAAAADWQRLPGLGGSLRFFPSHAPEIASIAGQLPLYSRRPIFAGPEVPRFVIGYGAGNVPGTALIIILLVFATTLLGEAPPVILVRNSRREPIFSPVILDALEEVDEELVSTVAVSIWDYEDRALQSRLLGEADLVIAAAGDDAIGRIGDQIPRAVQRAERPKARFHPHGHKVSFTAIGRDVFDLDRRITGSWGEGGLVSAVALLAGLDSVFWDQHGCLSSRVHFVERTTRGDTAPLEYAELLVVQLRRLSEVLPRGAWPLRQVRDSFDRYKAMESLGGVSTGLRVLSDYEDGFVVILDERSPEEQRPDARTFAALVNDCQGRVVLVRPVDDLIDVPRRYFSLLPARSLQTLSVAVGRPQEGLTRRFLDFATECGDRGVTAIRVVGRGAFPQLAYSWDGLLPLDLVRRRPAGRFTTIEFEQPFEAMMDTYRSFVDRMATMVGLLDTSPTGDTGQSTGSPKKSLGF